MRSAHPHCVLVLIDPTCQRPPQVAYIARQMPAGAAVVAVVLWPPPALTLNVRLLSWQARHRTLSTEDLVDLVRRTVHGAGPDTRDVAVSGHASHYRRSSAPKHGRVADAIVDLCRRHQPGLVVLPDGALIDGRVREQVRAQVPGDVAITLATPMTTPLAVSSGDGSGRTSGAGMTSGVRRLAALAALTVTALVTALNLTALAASISPCSAWPRCRSRSAPR